MWLKCFQSFAMLMKLSSACGLCVLTAERLESRFAFEINRSIWAAFVSIEFCVAWLLSGSY